ncbi:MAG: hypothetical protein SPL15_04335 [Lachnospiraceae bacterium]|nr:hypothetical protein [Lachnospiraceae bacterium]MDY5742206.1 hypothetical protein [Lachnospiraceae bacterium]
MKKFKTFLDKYNIAISILLGSVIISVVLGLMLNNSLMRVAQNIGTHIFMK